MLKPVEDSVRYSPIEPACVGYIRRHPEEINVGYNVPILTRAPLDFLEQGGLSDLAKAKDSGGCPSLNDPKKENKRRVLFVQQPLQSYTR
jgi:hypothetical protein